MFYDQAKKRLIGVWWSVETYCCNSALCRKFVRLRKFYSGGTGTAPVGTDSGVRSLGQVFIDSSIKRTANINLYKLDQRFKQSRINI